jgi:hypothetical protein
MLNRKTSWPMPRMKAPSVERKLRNWKFPTGRYV